MRRLPAAAWLALAACHDPLVYTVETGPRDWTAHPAVVSLPAATVYAASDVHGGYDRFVALLSTYGLVDASGAWAGGNAVLVIAGDMFDKGPKGLEVIDLVRALQPEAAAAGGAVIATLGNHEAEFFADPTNSKAESSDGIDTELHTRGIDLVAIASGTDPHGLWLRQQPFAARVGDWFFAHAGYTKGRAIDALESALETAFDTHDFEDDAFVGGDSLLEARDWYGDASAVARANAALGVAHTVFGHDPNALGSRGAIETAQQGALVRIDCGMSPDVDYSQGALLRIRNDGTGDIAEQLAADGTITKLWP